MTKYELAQELALTQELPLSTAIKTVEGVIRIIKDQLVKGNEITLRGFATICTANRKASVAHDFATGKSMKLAATRVVKIKPSKELKAALKG